MIAALADELGVNPRTAQKWVKADETTVDNGNAARLIPDICPAGEVGQTVQRLTHRKGQNMAKQRSKSSTTKRAAIISACHRRSKPRRCRRKHKKTTPATLCERQGYIVTEVYRDTEKYRANGRLVEPSGTRHDRPQFKRMLNRRRRRLDSM